MSQSDVSIEPLGAPDLPAVLELLSACRLPDTGVRENLEAFLVARSMQEIVACAGVETHGADGLLRSVAVAASRRGHGLGAALVGHLVRRSERQDLRALYLLTTTAHDYFPRLGFARCSRQDAPAPIRASWEFRTGCPQTAIVMMRSLRGSRGDLP